MSDFYSYLQVFRVYNIFYIGYSGVTNWIGSNVKSSILHLHGGTAALLLPRFMLYRTCSKIVFLGTLIFFVSSSFAATEKGAAGPPHDSSPQNAILLASIDNDSVRHLSENEREWYKKFQNGHLFFTGWKEICADILESLPNHEELKTRKLLQSMGQRIGTEWAKNNAVRKIDTADLRTWGERLRQAKDTGSSQLYEAVEAISVEVERKLQHNE